MIKLTDVKKEYKDFSLDISIDIPDGRVTGLIGKNGAGKTTLIKAMLGLISVDGGSVEVFGKNISQLKPEDKGKIGVALSESGFSNYFNIRDVAGIMDKLYEDFDKEEFIRVCTENNLPKDKNIKDFSTGMKAKLKVFVALSHKANLLILDEPTAGLDVEARQEILDLIRDYLSKDDRRSLLISSHISTDLEGLCDDIYLIDNGKIILHEDADVIPEKYALLKADEETYEKLDKSHILSTKKETFGYVCFTDEKQYYKENYPDLVVEDGKTDDMILMLTGGK